MVKITNGVDVFEVTTGAFDGIYSRQGYTVMSDKKAEVVSEVESPGEEDEVEDEVFAREMLEKPMSSWSKKEIKRFARLKGVDLAGTSNSNEARFRIKEYLDNIQEIQEIQE